jgi:hypothetical protein
MVRSLSPHRQIAGRIVVGQARRLPGFSCSRLSVRGAASAVSTAFIFMRIAPSYFLIGVCKIHERPLVYEELSESSAFGSGRCDLHGGFRGRQAELSEDG